jgi:hypothetical protein
MNEIQILLENFLNSRLGETITRGLLDALYNAVQEHLNKAAPVDAAVEMKRGPGRPPKVDESAAV